MYHSFYTAGMIVRNQKRNHEFHLQPGIGIELSYNFIERKDERYLKYFTLPMQLINEYAEQKMIDNIKRAQTYDPTINVTNELQKSTLRNLIQKKQPQKQFACQILGVSRKTKPFTPRSSGMQRDILHSKVYSTPLYKTELPEKQQLAQHHIIDDLSVHDLEQDYDNSQDDNSCLFYDDEREMSTQLNCVQRPISRKKPGLSTKRISSANMQKINDGSTPLASQQSLRPQVTPINVTSRPTSRSVIIYKPYSRLYDQYQVK